MPPSEWTFRTEGPVPAVKPNDVKAVFEVLASIRPHHTAEGQ
jgi:hypothetical protein